MPFVKVASVAAVPAGSMVHAKIGDELYVVCNVNGDLHAMDGRCPHAGGPLGEGNLQGHIVASAYGSFRVLYAHDLSQIIDFQKT